jgi:hypothetical protein
MKEGALRVVREIDDPSLKMNLLREYIQAFTLRSMHESKAFQCLSFVGGTALRLLHGLPRFSEDLDFSLENADGYDPKTWLKKIKRDLIFAGFNATVTWNDRKIVHTGWLSIAELMGAAGLTDIPEQMISIKVEIDTEPPRGAILESSIINRHMIFALQHHNLPSLLAGKIHALCTRKYLKGFDWYDMVCYGARRPIVKPNIKLLGNALARSGKEAISKAEQWNKYLIARLDKIDQKKLVKDIEPFLEEPKEINLLTKENLKKSIMLFHNG